MAKQLQLRSGTATEHNNFTGANGEVTVDTTNKTLRVHDGSTVGGTRLATLTGGLVPVSQLPDATTTVKGAVILNNTLTSTSTTEALTAAQGKVLKDSLDNAINSPLGVGQAWQNLTSSRISGVYYTNSTGRPIAVSISLRDVGYIDYVVSVNGVVVIKSLKPHEYDERGPAPFQIIDGGLFFIVPTGATYAILTENMINDWAELR